MTQQGGELKDLVATEVASSFNLAPLTLTAIVCGHSGAPPLCVRILAPGRKQHSERHIAKLEKCHSLSWDPKDKCVLTRMIPPGFKSFAISVATTQGMAKCSKTAIE
jgi:hypothetical protein